MGPMNWKDQCGSKDCWREDTRARELEGRGGSQRVEALQGDLRGGAANGDDADSV